MKEQLIKLWERKERYIEDAIDIADRKTYFSQAFGALEMVLVYLNDWEREDEYIELWNEVWKPRLEEKVYEVR
jgi:hypothetical protein